MWVACVREILNLPSKIIAQNPIIEMNWVPSMVNL